MPKEPEMMTLDEAIEHVMRTTGKSRRQAKAALFEKARQGKIRATGIPAGSDDRVDIPPEAWPKIN